jgi:hypothetical protein
MKALLAAAVAAALSLSAAAHAGALVEVSVIDRDTGALLPAHSHHGKLYVAGTPGHRYSVRLYNRTNARVLTVLSVDGVNAITGQSADPKQSGYVLDPYQSTDIAGWRKDMSQIAQFNFTALEDSYAARTGRPNNVGVIGVAVFREKAPVWRVLVDDRISRRDAQPAPQYPREAANAAAEPPPPAMPATAAKDTAQAAGRAEAAPGASVRGGDFAAKARQVPRSETLGTGHGARESSYASYTAFERASTSPDEVDSIWYDSYRNQVAKGVIREPRPIAIEPQPFPNPFVPDPAG